MDEGANDDVCCVGIVFHRSRAAQLVANTPKRGYRSYGAVKTSGSP